MNRGKIDRLIDEAKGAIKPFEEEPLVSSDWVLLREVGRVLEHLRAVPGRRPMNDSSEGPPEQSADPALLEVYELLLEGLITQALFAFTTDTNTIIPVSEWLAYKNREKTAYGSCFWCGPFILHDGSRAFVGKLPAIKRSDAVRWLEYQQTGPISGGRPTKSDCLKIYNQLFPLGHKEKGVPWKDVERMVSERMGESVSERTISRYLKQSKQDKAE